MVGDGDGPSVCDHRVGLKGAEVDDYEVVTKGRELDGMIQDPPAGFV